MTPAKNKKAEIRRRLLRGETVRAVVAATRSGRATVCEVVRELGLDQARHVRWIVPIPRALSARADAARGNLSRSAFVVAALQQYLGVEP